KKWNFQFVGQDSFEKRTSPQQLNLATSQQAHTQSLSGSWLRAEVSHPPRTP
ncbi:unnamed protein product, partial [Gulo gulo]